MTCSAAHAPRGHGPRTAPVNAVSAPTPILRTKRGETARDVLGTARVLPKRLPEPSFTFAAPDIEGALKAALTGP
ncbi:DUF1731 domain-containing protein [Streptomyces longisporus]|uniref:DUF1731 domain-containing protein n=1 Tax=Streptomyces longisporus TaxID=1948 RepID=UPI003CD0A259